MGEARRWVEVALPGTPTTIALAPPPNGREPGGSQTGIFLDTTEVDADHADAEGGGRRRRRRGHPLRRAGAADVLAARPRRQLADHRPAARLSLVADDRSDLGVPDSRLRARPVSRSRTARSRARPAVSVGVRRRW